MSSRRNFLKQAGVISAAFALPTVPFDLLKSSFKLGLQLYTVREPMKSDLKGTLKEVASMGYQIVETYGFNYGDNKYYWGLHPREAKQLLDDCHLTSPSGHYDLDKYFGKSQHGELKAYVDECIEGALTLNQEFIVWPWLAPQYRSIDEFKRLSETLNSIGEQIKAGGLRLAYHNHDFEFITHNGEYGFDILLSETEPDLVKFELDLFWAMHSSPYPPSNLIRKYPNRFILWHLKDMDAADSDLHVPLGTGRIDFKEILKATSVSGVKYMYVEQGNNYVPNVMDNIRTSANYFHTNLM